MLLVLNAHHDLVQFTLPPCSGGDRWELVLDTNVPDARQAPRFASASNYGMTGRSLVLFALVA